MADAKREMNHFQSFQLYATLTTQLTVIATNLQRMQSEIINVLTDIRHNTISPTVKATTSQDTRAPKG